MTGARWGVKVEAVTGRRGAIPHSFEGPRAISPLRFDPLLQGRASLMDPAPRPPWSSTPKWCSERRAAGRLCQRARPGRAAAHQDAQVAATGRSANGRRRRGTDRGQGRRSRADGRGGRRHSVGLPGDRSGRAPPGLPTWRPLHGARGGRFSCQGAKLLGEAANRRRATIGILVDLDVGMGRTGVQTAVRGPQAGPVRRCHARAAARRPVLLSRPHRRPGASQQQPALHGCQRQAGRDAQPVADHGLQARIVSGGSTPTAYQSHLVGEYTEIRPGTYVYNDMNTVRGGYCTLDDCAARIICTVVSTAVPGQVVIDAGSKTLTSDLCGRRARQRLRLRRRVSRGQDHEADRRARPDRHPRLPAGPAARRAVDGHPEPHLPLRQSARRRLVAQTTRVSSKSCPSTPAAAGVAAPDLLGG